MQRTLSLLLLLALLDTVCCLTCRRCSTVSCKTPTCTTGLVKDVCGCCDVCAKAEGEYCGGPWGTTGTCDQGLTCYKVTQPGDRPYDVLNRVGVCRPSGA